MKPDAEWRVGDYEGYGRGVGVPTSPPASTPARSRNMAAIRRRDTAPEKALRSLLHASGLRFRVDFPIRLEGQRPIRPDVVLTRHRIAIFVDGCFWHGCPEHGRRERVKNESYWRPKIAGNVARDERHTALLTAAGWTVLRFWEHDAPERATERILVMLRENQAIRPAR